MILGSWLTDQVEQRGEHEQITILVSRTLAPATLVPAGLCKALIVAAGAARIRDRALASDVDQPLCSLLPPLYWVFTNRPKRYPHEFFGHGKRRAGTRRPTDSKSDESNISRKSLGQFDRHEH